MHDPLILASGSRVRAELLRQARVPFEVRPVSIDEAAVRAALVAEDATPQDIADTLAEMKAQRVSSQVADALVIGCDQVLAFQDDVLGKPADLPELREQLGRLRGKSHELVSAVVVYQDGKPLWRHAGKARLTMRNFSDDWIASYLDRHGDALLDTVGGYKIEEEGIRLFTRIEGDYFAILGLPLLELLSWLTVRGTLPS
jgi:septum formation protein